MKKFIMACMVVASTITTAQAADLCESFGDIAAGLTQIRDGGFSNAEIRSYVSRQADAMDPRIRAFGRNKFNWMLPNVIFVEGTTPQGNRNRVVLRCNAENWTSEMIASSK